MISMYDDLIVLLKIRTIGISLIELENCVEPS